MPTLSRISFPSFVSLSECRAVTMETDIRKIFTVTLTAFITSLYFAFVTSFRPDAICGTVHCQVDLSEPNPIRRALECQVGRRRRVLVSCFARSLFQQFLFHRWPHQDKDMPRGLTLSVTQIQ